MTREEALETAECMKKSLDTGDITEPETQSITLGYSSYIDNALTFKPMDPKDMKVVIWGKELTSVAEWEDFLKIGKELKQENEQLKEQLEREMDLIGELDGYFEDIFTELDRNWREDKKWQGGMKGWYKEAIREIKELKQQLVEKDKENEELRRDLQLECVFTPVRCDGKTFTKLDIIQDFKNLIRNQVCDEIREFIDNNEHSEENEAKQSSESVVYTMQLYKFLDQIEQVKENMK